MNILAIDPGASGGLAHWDGTRIEAKAMPETEGDICDYLRDVASHDPTTVVYLEQVGGFVRGKEGKQPGSAMFNFGRNYGFLLGCCNALGLRLELVMPNKWQKNFPTSGLTGDPKKRALKEHAQRLHPEKKVTLKTCDAFLILEYAMEQKR